MTSHFNLNTGAQIPAIGLGTWQDEDAQENAVYEALKAGYRHIDTAQTYGTEKAVGKGIKKSGVPRSEIFLTTKLWNNNHHPADVGPSLDDSLRELETDYVDLLLMHWPVAWERGPEPFPQRDGKPAVIEVDYVDTYKAMENLIPTGKARAIGVSNFSKAEVERVLQNSLVVPAVHQFERHPWLQQREFVDWHKSKGIHVTQYSPLGNQNALYPRGEGIGRLVEDPVLVEIGKKYNKSAAQVALAWGITGGQSVIPKSKTPARIKNNLEGNFKLSEEDVQKISGIDRKLRFNDSSSDFGYNLFSDLEGKK
ncbi:Aldo/keto reductase [Aspergillus campestris IBT 28561]|uniref:D-xylose reductase [NAD(P)H] n=1 Tax=Aspergillus campestris (strain IBT 28561) TaxID=1392248 RepID=A0A2I1DBQ9_ASPC2|nr:Aldo/keto reductase [Aspergillus campestris IBT 28561]PKY07315.1 Aldo/keto reductase [Aspergillus campestris IBT 28561]